MAFIIKPLVTEKMTKITDKFPNRYGFIVSETRDFLDVFPSNARIYSRLMRHASTFVNEQRACTSYLM